MQLARNIRPRDLEEFFSKVGQVRDEMSFDIYIFFLQVITICNVIIAGFRCAYHL